jgi:TPR repeat protein
MALHPALRYKIRIMFSRILIILLIAASVAMGQKADTKRISKGDPLAKVYRQLGTPAVEYPLNGQLVQEYAQCTIISRNDRVLSADYKTTAEAVDDPVEEKKPPTIEELKAMARQGDAESQYLLAYCFQFGKAVDQNYAAAIAWYKKSAMQGHMSSQHNLGYLYMKGKGVEQDYVQAYAWALLAAENGNNTMKKALDYKLSEAQKLAGELGAEQMKLQMQAHQADAEHQDS